MADQNYGNYPDTPHPEDQPGYGYASYQDNQNYPGSYAAPLGNPGQPGQPGQPGVREAGTGTVDVMRAVNWAFSATFKNWTVWILGALAFFAAIVVVSMTISIVAVVTSGGEPTTNPLLSLLSGLLGMAVSLLFYNAATRQLDRQKIGWGDFFRGMNAGPLIGFLLLNAVLGLLIMTVGELVTTGSVQTLTGAEPSTDWEDLSRLLLGQLGATLVSLLIAPLVVFIPYYLADRRAGFVDAIRLGISAGARNYGKLLLTMFLMGLVGGLAVLVTLGLGVLVVLPVIMLVYAHLYRQASGFELPVEQH